MGIVIYLALPTEKKVGRGAPCDLGYLSGDGSKLR